MTPLPDQIRWETNSPEETNQLGISLGRSLAGGCVLALVGPLGAGKTLLVKGIADGNSVEDRRCVTSPTFTLVNEYSGRLTLYHIDVYRLSSPVEFVALGFDELVRPDAAVVVEWADRVRKVMPSDSLWIEIAPTSESGRRLHLSAGGSVAAECLKTLRAQRR